MSNIRSGDKPLRTEQSRRGSQGYGNELLSSYSPQNTFQWQDNIPKHDRDVCFVSDFSVATKTEYSWIYSGALSSSSQVFYRPYGSKINYYYLQAIEVSVSTSGTYIFASNSSIDTVGYLYTSPFDPSNPLSNLITNDDDSGDISYQFEIEAYLLPRRPYVLVVTTHSPVITGRFAISAVGPAPVILTSIMASTSRPITTRKFLINTLMSRLSRIRFCLPTHRVVLLLFS